MKNSGLHILSTIKLPSEFLNEAREKGASIDEIEVIQTVHRQNIEQARIAFRESECLIFTSIAAVDAIVSGTLPKEYENKTIYCVGSKVASYFKRATVIKADNASELARLILKDLPKSITYFHGNRSLNTIQNKLEFSDVNVKNYVVYDTLLIYPKVDLTQYRYVWFFSPSGVESLTKNNEIPDNTISVAIGETTASSFATGNCLISKKPDIKSMLDCTLTKHFSNDPV